MAHEGTHRKTASGQGSKWDWWGEASYRKRNRLRGLIPTAALSTRYFPELVELYDKHVRTRRAIGAKLLVPI
jgi:hypothetical protein